jgi:hypothetical protein
LELSPAEQIRLQNKVVVDLGDDDDAAQDREADLDPA